MSYYGAYYQTRTLLGNDPPTRHWSIAPVNDNGIMKLMRNGYTLLIVTPSGALVRNAMWSQRDIRMEVRGIRDALYAMGYRNARMANYPWTSLLRRYVPIDGVQFDRWIKPT